MSFLSALTNPTRATEQLARDVLRSVAAHAGRSDAPAWVEAIRDAGMVTRPSAADVAERMILRNRLEGEMDRRGLAVTTRSGVPKTRLERDSFVGSAWMRQAYSTGILPDQAREFSRSNEWVRAAVNKLKGRVSRAERSIMPIDPDRPYDLKVQAQIVDLIENPNPRLDSWRGFSEPWVEDVLVCGKGGFEYVPNYKQWPIWLLPFDAQFMKVLPGWDGTSPATPRYAWGPPSQKQKGILNEEATVILLNPTTYRTEGIPPIEILRNSIESDSAGNEFVRSMLRKYPPPGWIHLGKSATRKQVQQVSERLSSDVLGQGGMLVTGGVEDPKFQSLWVGTSRENELMAWSIYFARKIAAVFNISPQDFGVTFDINKSTSETQESMSLEDGFKAVLLLVEEYVNREVIGKFGRPEDINLAFRFKELTIKDRLKQAQLVKMLMGDVPAVTLNEGRRELDLPPLELGYAIYVSTATGVSAVIGEDADEFRQKRMEHEAEMMDLMAQDDRGKTGDPSKGEPAAKKPKGSGSDKAEAGSDKSKSPKPDKGDKATASVTFLSSLELDAAFPWEPTAFRREWQSTHLDARDQALMGLRAHLRLSDSIDGKRDGRHSVLHVADALDHVRKTYAPSDFVLGEALRRVLQAGYEGAYALCNKGDETAIPRWADREAHVFQLLGLLHEGWEEDLRGLKAKLDAPMRPQAVELLLSRFLERRMAVVGKHITRYAYLTGVHAGVRGYVLEHPETEQRYRVEPCTGEYPNVRLGAACQNLPLGDLSPDDVLALELPGGIDCVHYVSPV